MGSLRGEDDCAISKRQIHNDIEDRIGFHKASLGGSAVVSSRLLKTYASCSMLYCRSDDNDNVKDLRTDQRSLKRSRKATHNEDGEGVVEPETQLSG